MVRLLLSVRAELENLSELQPASTDFDFFFQVKCTSCNEVHPNLVTVNPQEERDMSVGRGTANFVWRCAMCKRESSAKFDPASPIKPYNGGDALFAPFLVIECRGLEFIGFEPSGTWKAVGATGTQFNEIDFSEDDWTDYDEKAALPVGVARFESQWTRA